MNERPPGNGQRQQRLMLHSNKTDISGEQRIHYRNLSYYSYTVRVRYLTQEICVDFLKL